MGSRRASSIIGNLQNRRALRTRPSSSSTAFRHRTARVATAASRWSDGRAAASSTPARDGAAGLPLASWPHRARPRAVQPARGGGPWSPAGRGGRAAPRGACPLAGPRPRRPRLRTVRRGGDPAAGRASFGSDRAAYRCRPRARTAPGSHHRAPAASRPATATGATAGSAHAGVVPVGPAGRGARRLQGSAAAPSRAARTRAGPGPPGARGGDSSPGQITRPRAAPGAGAVDPGRPSYRRGGRLLAGPWPSRSPGIRRRS
jgi:hypothetical protein